MVYRFLPSIINISRLPDTQLAALSMLLATFAFVSVNAVVKHLIEAHDWTQLLWLRGVVGLIMVLLLLMLQQHPVKRLVKQYRTSLGLLSIRALLEIGMFASFILALKTVSIGFAAAFVLIAPALASLLGMLILKESAYIHRILTIMFSFVGALIIVNPIYSDVSLEPILWLSSSVLFFCVNTLLARRYAIEATPIQVTLFTHWVMAVLLAPFAFLFWIDIAATEWLIILYMGVAGIAGTYFYSLSLAKKQSAFVASFYYTEVVWAIVFDVLLWHQMPGLGMLMGALMIIAVGIYAIQQEYQLKPM